MPIVIKFCRKLKARQTILHYVDNHASKAGTPTMGGIGFIIAIAVATLLAGIGTDNALAIVSVLAMIAFGIVGFLDDFIKVFFKQNKGLLAWQKIVFQTAIALIVAFFAYFNPIVSGQIIIPFTLYPINLYWFAVPFFLIIFLAFSNAVNLTDGLDGLASKLVLCYMLFNAGLIFLFALNTEQGQANIEEYTNLIVFAFSIIGALTAFLIFNGFPAKVFMGDTGALALGGSVGALAIVSGLSLYSPLIGIMFVLTCLSVMMQVMYFKATKGKRIFLMSPLHHHFERKGIHENRIVNAYVAVTAVIGSLMLLITLLVTVGI
ncbi:MAG: phospho-N-acetylmuramoyl-pentapeptide-transferase [Firmicutes bacterium]|nr:phospho-N-acetylmuramoyl-pentapeptide-transferase [Bacillota bacterium]